MHEVASNENLGDVASRLGISVATLLGLNPEVTDPERLRVGRRLEAGRTPGSRQRTTPSRHDLLPGFRGDLAWIHDREGHVGRPYWPGGESGVTLDPGIDIGYCDPALVHSLFADSFSAEQLAAVQGAHGVTQQDAESLLERDEILASCRVSRERAQHLFPYVASPYWEALTERFPTLTEATTPPAVHTALLSLGYNRGPHNRHLGVLQGPLERRDWRALAATIAGMQQDHVLRGIRERRRLEASLVGATASDPWVPAARHAAPAHDMSMVTGMLIRRPVHEVFEAFVDPERTNKFWFTHGSDRLEAGRTVTWRWAMHDLAVQVAVLEVEPDRSLVVEFPGEPPTTASWSFAPQADGSTIVQITHRGFASVGSALVNEVADSSGGFALVLAGLKAYLEHGIRLDLVADRRPDLLPGT